MIRDLDRLAGHTFDVLVVGGGIYGLTIAYDAAQRGLSVALIERDDFGSGDVLQPPAHHSRRAALPADARLRARARVGARAADARADRAARGPSAALRAPALPIAHERQAGDARRRSRSIGSCPPAATTASPPRIVCPAGRVVSRGNAVQRFPGLRRQGLTGAAVFYDYVTTESDRLTFSFAPRGGRARRRAGQPRRGRRARWWTAGASSASARQDALDGRTLEIAARLTVNATGAAVDRLLKPLGLSTGMPMLKAMNLVTRRDAGDEALGGRSSSGRNLFLVPWRERALFGTWESDRVCDPDGYRRSRRATSRRSSRS